MMDYMELGDIIVSTLKSDKDLNAEKIQIVPVMSQSAIQGGFLAYQRSDLIVHRAKQIITGYTVTYLLSIIHPTSYNEAKRLSGLVRKAMQSMRIASLEKHTESYIDGVGYIQSITYVIEI